MFLFKKVPTVSAKELGELLASQPVMIDVREKNEFIAGHIPGAKNIPLGKINRFKGKTTEKVYVICQSGARSKQAVSQLTDQGYEAFNLKNGMMGWQGKIRGGLN